MEKISRIVPSSPRITSVDLKESHPIRPGMPTFGRPQGRSVASSTGMPPKFPPQDVLYFNPIEQRNSAIVNDLAERFFGRNQTDAEEPTDEISLPRELSSSLPSIQSIQPAPLENSDEPLSDPAEIPLNRSEVESEFDKGQFIDRYI